MTDDFSVLPSIESLLHSCPCRNRLPPIYHWHETGTGNLSCLCKRETASQRFSYLRPSHIKKECLSNSKGSALPSSPLKIKAITRLLHPIDASSFIAGLLRFNSDTKSLDIWVHTLPQCQESLLFKPPQCCFLLMVGPSWTRQLSISHDKELISVNDARFKREWMTHKRKRFMIKRKYAYP